MSEEKETEEKEIEKFSLAEEILETEGFVIETGKPIEITILDNGVISG